MFVNVSIDKDDKECLVKSLNLVSGFIGTHYTFLNQRFYIVGKVSNRNVGKWVQLVH